MKRVAFVHIDSEQLAGASGGFTWPWQKGFHWPWQSPQPSHPSTTGGFNRCENPKHVPFLGAQAPIIGGPTVKLPTFPCIDFKKRKT